MIHSQNTKTVVLVKPQSVATNATATGSVDCKGFSQAKVTVVLDSAAAVSSNPAVLKLAEGDTTSSYTDIGVFTGDDTTDGFTIPNADTESPQVIRMNVDLRKRKRYLRLSLTSAGAAQLSAATIDLSRAEDGIDSATDAGAAAVVTG